MCAISLLYKLNFLTSVYACIIGIASSALSTASISFEMISLFEIWNTSPFIKSILASFQQDLSQ